MDTLECARPGCDGTFCPATSGNGKHRQYCSENCRKRKHDQALLSGKSCKWCGGHVGNRTARSCWDCEARGRVDRRMLVCLEVEGLWHEGLSLTEIALRLGKTQGSVGVLMNRMRGEGFDLPYRRPSRHPRWPEQAAA